MCRRARVWRTAWRAGKADVRRASVDAASARMQRAENDIMFLSVLETREQQLRVVCGERRCSISGGVRQERRPLGVALVASV